MLTKWGKAISGGTIDRAALNRKYEKNDLAGCALRFIREGCTDLRFMDIDEDETAYKFKGMSVAPDQVPYNMQMDTDRLCLENSLQDFLESGKKEDAFTVYFCYIDMFFGNYKKIGRIIEFLSEYELNGARLLLKHRDHYVHSVYVFALGLAIFESSSYFRKCYLNKYFGGDEKSLTKAYHHFLKYWGFTSLFHDVGYPFELPFEQVCSYFETGDTPRSKCPYIAYSGMESYAKINKTIQRRLSAIYGLGTDKIIHDTDELFAYVLAKDLSKEYYFSEKEMLDVLRAKPAKPNQFGFFMDHGYFSATVLFRKLFCDFELELEKEHIDALSAIILHNSLYKFSVADYKSRSNIPFKAELSPLAFMLMLCDEMQCWDRTAYGRNSKLEMHPMSCELEFSDNEIKAAYIFDDDMKCKADKFKEELASWNGKGNPPKLKAFSEMYVSGGKKECKFIKDIKSIVDLDNINVSVNYDFKVRTKAKGTLSTSNFINLYHFAEVLNGRYQKLDEWKKLDRKNKLDIEEFVTDKDNVKLFEEAFEKQSLEYKLSNIHQAIEFDRYLNEIGCFYSDRDIDFEILHSFDDGSLEKIGPMEHGRWVNEHLKMGWGYISDDKLKELAEESFGSAAPGKDELKKRKKMLRELYRLHPDMPVGFNGEAADEAVIRKNFERLSKAEQDKDTDPMNCMLAMLRVFDGLRIYKMN